MDDLFHNFTNVRTDSCHLVTVNTYTFIETQISNKFDSNYKFKISSEL